MSSRKKKVVFFGGGTGLPTLFTALRHYSWIDIVAIVSVFDSGGSSGALRDKYGVLPPSDILRCILGLSNDPGHVREFLTDRIPIEIEGVESNPDHPVGHMFGNLMFVPMIKDYGLKRAIEILSKKFAIHGKVIPVTLESSHLKARFADGSIVENEVAVDKGIQNGRRVEELFLDPSVEANPDAIEAIRSADAFVVGPGSFYTSVLSNFLPEGVIGEIYLSSSPIIFILNIMTEGSGMDHVNGASMNRILERKFGRCIARTIVNTSILDDYCDRYAAEGRRPLSMSERDHSGVIARPLWINGELARHDPYALSAVLSETIHELT